MPAQNIGIKLEITGNSASAKEALNDIGASLKDLPGKVDKSAKSTKGLKTAFNDANSAVTKFSSSIQAQIGMAGALGLITTLAVNSVKSLADFEDKMVGVAKTTGMSAEDIKKLGDALRTMSVENMQGIVGAETLAEIAEAAGQLGISGSENILSFTKAIAEMDVATDLSGQQAAEALAQIENVFRDSLEASGKTAEELTANIGSAFNELSNTTTATVADITELVKRMAGASTTIGLRVDEVAGIAATLKNAGVNLEVGGTAMTQFMLELVKDSEIFADSFKLDAAALANALEDEPMQAIQMVLQGMSDLKEAEGPAALANALDDVGVSGTRIQDTLLKLSGATEDLEKNVKTSIKAFQEGSSLHEEFVTASQSTMKQWTGIGEKSKELFRSFGEELKPATTLLTKWASGGLDVVLKAVNEWQGGVKDEFFDAVVAQFQALPGEISKAIKDVKEIIVAPFREAKEEIIGAVDEIKFQISGDKAPKLEFKAQDALDTLQEMRGSLEDQKKIFAENEKLAKKYKEVWKGMQRAIEDNREPTERLKEQFIELQEELEELGAIAYEGSVLPDIQKWLEKDAAAADAFREGIEGVSDAVEDLGDEIEETKGSFAGFVEMSGELSDNLGTLGGGLGKLGDILGIKELDQAGDFLGQIQEYAQIPQILSDVSGALSGILPQIGGIGEALGGLFGGGGLGGIGEALSGLFGGGGIGSALSSLAAAAGPLAIGGAALAAALPAFKAIPGILSDIFGGESEGSKAASAWRGFVDEHIEGGAEMVGAMTEQYHLMQEVGGSYGDYLNQIGLRTHDVLGGFSGDWEIGSTALDRFGQAMQEAGVQTDKVPQVVLQTIGAFEEMGMSADEVAAQLGEMIGEIMGTSAASEEAAIIQDMLASSVELSAEEIEALKARLELLSESAQIGGENAELLSDSLEKTSETVVLAQDEFEMLREKIEKIPDEKTIRINIKTVGSIPGLAAGGLFSGGLALVGERGPEGALFPGGAKSVVGLHGPGIGAFPAGTQIIPNTQLASFIKNIPRMAGGGTVQAAPNIYLSVNITGNTIDKNINLDRLADDVSKRIAKKIRPYMS